VVAREALKDRDRLKKREAAFEVPTRISYDNAGSDIHTIIEVDTRDRPGLLHDLSRTLAANNVTIVSAVIVTYGEQGGGHVLRQGHVRAEVPRRGPPEGARAQAQGRRRARAPPGPCARGD
jgi:hypothetical protein